MVLRDVTITCDVLRRLIVSPHVMVSSFVKYFLNLRIVGRIFIKFGMDVKQLESTPIYYILISYNIQYQEICYYTYL
jgi:hypothetical protein